MNEPLKAWQIGSRVRLRKQSPSSSVSYGPKPSQMMGELACNLVCVRGWSQIEWRMDGLFCSVLRVSGPFCSVLSV